MDAPALVALIAAPWLAAAVLGLSRHPLLRWTPYARLRLCSALAGAGALVSLLALGALAGPTLAGDVQRIALPWLPAFDANLGLRLDAHALLMCGLILGIGLLVLLYARHYLAAHEDTPRFFALLMAFMGAMLGIALADNLILLGVFWELTSLSSFLLIAFWTHRPEARQGARMALTVTGLGGLALLAGLCLLGWMAGSWSLEGVLSQGERIRNHSAYPVMLALVLAGAFTKSAQFPVHFWLPHAMAAPTPVSAYLHSATMVKAGLFLLARLHPALSGTELWFYAVTSAGAATLLVGAWHAIFQHDLKGLLAYSTISHLGLIMMLLGLGSEGAALAALFHLLNHATFKASLFMAVGIIDHETGTRDLRRINGLARRMPVTSTLAMVAAAAMAGVPLLNGFLSKEMFFAETLLIRTDPWSRMLVPGVALVAAALSVAYSARFVHDTFFNGEPRDLPRTPHEPPWGMRWPVMGLVALCLAVGLAPGVLMADLLQAASRDMLQVPVAPPSIALWHGWNLPLAMSAIALTAGALLYAGLQRLGGLHDVPDNPGAGKRRFEQIVQTLESTALRGVRRLAAVGQHGQLTLTLLMALGLALLPVLINGIPAGLAEPAPAHDATIPAGVLLAAIALWLLGVAGALGTLLLGASRLAAVLALALCGLAVSLAFVVFSAPDLALTQLLVEVVSLVLMALALRHLPASPAGPEPLAMRLRDLGLAVLAGLAMGLATWAVLDLPADSLSGHYISRAVPEAGGTNVVNVIIVDFRGFDTLGETFVMACAALVIHALLAGRVLRHAVPLTPPGLVLGTVAQGLLPFGLMVSVFLFLRGHNLPGGGFIAGLVAAIVLVLQILAGREGRLSHPSLWLGLTAGGLIVLTLTGVASWLWGYPFLTTTFAHPALPLVGEVALASAAAFDLGVYLTVIGATVLMLLALGRTEQRAG